MKKEIFKKAHKLTKDIIKKGDNYRATFKLCLSFVYSQIKKGVNKMVELIGSEKQVKWAENIRRDLLVVLNTIKEADKERKIRKNKNFEESSKKMDIAIDFISSQTDSKFFIDNFREVLKETEINKLYKFRDIVRDNKKCGINNISAITTFAVKELA